MKKLSLVAYGKMSLLSHISPYCAGREQKESKTKNRINYFL